MAATDVLKEFLVLIGFKLDEPGQKKAFEAVTKVEKGLVTLAASATAASLAVTAALGKMAQGFEDAFYATSRASTSVKELNSFKYAASQMGSTAEEAQGAVEGLARKIRETGGASGGIANLLRSLGAKDPANTVKALNDIAPRLAQMPIAQAEAYAKALEIPEHLLLALRQVGELQKRQAEANQKYGVLGFDAEQAAKDGKELTQAFRGLYDTIEKLATKTGSGLFKQLQPQIESLNTFLQAHGQEITDTIIKIGKALFQMFDWVVRHIPDIDHFVESIGGWTTAFTALSAIITAAFVGRLGMMLASLSGLFKLAPPAWWLGMMGLAGYGAVKAGDAAQGLFDRGFNAISPGANTPEYLENQNMGVWDRAKRVWRRITGQGASLSGNEAIARRGHVSANVPEMVKSAKDQLIKEGVNAANADAAAAALVGNVMQESRGNPNAVHDNGTGYGLYGARLGRRDRMLEWLAKNGYPRNSVEGQMRYMAHEAMTDPTYRPTARALRGASRENLGDVTNTVAVNFESPSPATAGYANRRNNAAAALDRASQAVKSLTTKLPPIAPKAASPYGALNPDAMRPLFNPMPLGGGSNDNSRSVTMQQHNHVNVTGVSDPTSAAGQVGAKMDKHSSMLLKNLQSAVA